MQISCFEKLYPRKNYIIFINKLQFLIFFHFFDLRNLVKRMYSMVPCCPLLNMKIIWLYMVSAPSPILMGGEGDMKICQNFVLKNFCLHLRQDKSLWVELKTNGGGCNIYYSITTISLFHFIRNSQHPEKWDVSFKNFFRKCECISFCLPLSSNLQIQF